MTRLVRVRRDQSGIARSRLHAGSMHSVRAADDLAPEHADAWPKPRAVRAVQVIWLVAASLLLLASPLLVLGIGDALSRLDPSVDGAGVVTLTSVDAGTWIAVLAVALAVAATAGAPWGRAAVGDGTSSPALPVLGGLVLAGGSGLLRWLANAFYFTSQADGCAHPGCVPLTVQTWLLIAPAVITGVVLVALGVGARRGPWWPRAVVPTAVWLCVSVAQVALWDSKALPLIEQSAAR